MDNLKRIDWTEISDRGLLTRINKEIMHPLGLAVYRDVETGVSGGAMVSQDGPFVYTTDQTEAEVVARIKAEEPWVEIIVGSYGLVAIVQACPTVQNLFVNDAVNMLELVKEIRTSYFSDRKGNPRPPLYNRFLITLEINDKAGRAGAQPVGKRRLV